MRGSPWHATQTGKLSSAHRWQRNWGKVVSTKVSFVLPTHQIIKMSSSSSVSSTCSIIVVATRIFCLKTRKNQGSVSRQSRNLFGLEKPFVKLRPTYSVKLVFSCCKGNKNENNFKVSCLETPSLCRYKQNYVTWNEPKKFWNFWETGLWVFSI